MNFNVLTLFPDFIQSYLKEGVIGRALQDEKLSVNIVNPREFAKDVHNTVDDKPFGGGDGMLMMYGPLKDAVDSLGDKGLVVYLSPHGKPWSNDMAASWASKYKSVTLVCGRYAGVDQRFINECCDEQVSLGDFVLSGGELAALSVIDSVSRMRPGVLGNAQSSLKESFQEDGLLECPQFTRPREVGDVSVPVTLLSGDHKKIENYKKQISIVLTACLRPDLLHLAVPEITKAFDFVCSLESTELQALGLTEATLEKGKINVRRK